jgi:hypothetical protein
VKDIYFPALVFPSPQLLFYHFVGVIGRVSQIPYRIRKFILLINILPRCIYGDISTWKKGSIKS